MHIIEHLCITIHGKKEFFHGNHQTLTCPWYIYGLKDDVNTIGLQILQYIRLKNQDRNLSHLHML